MPCPLALTVVEPADRWTLLAVAVVVIGLALRLRPILVVLAAAVTAAAVSHVVLGREWTVDVGTPGEVVARAASPLEVFGKSFVGNRVMSLFVVLLPAIGLAERLGLRREAARLIAKAPGGTPGAVGVAYMVLRFVLGMLGLRVNGHATFVRPIVAPMAEGSAGPGATEADVERVKAATAAAENFGNFYGQNLFLAAGGLLLAAGVMAQNGYAVGLAEMARACVPVAVAACVLGVLAFARLDRRVPPRGPAPLPGVVPFLTGGAIGVALLLAWGLVLPDGLAAGAGPAGSRPRPWDPWFMDFPAGLALASVAGAILLDRGHPSRLPSGAFYGLFALTFLLADPLLLARPAVAGALALAMTGLGALELAPRASSGDPARVQTGIRSLLVVIVPTACAGLLGWLSSLIGRDTNSGILAGVAVGGVLAALAAIALSASAEGGGAAAATRRLLSEGTRLTEMVGAVMILPQLLTAMGAVFDAAGVGQVIGELAATHLPAGTKLGSAVVYAVAMAAFTFLMGNSFAAFAVITGGIGIPLLVVAHGADAARVALFGLTAASSGTLVSPMAVNFNIVPAALLELRDRYAVIRFQAPVAVALLVVHVGLLAWAT